MVCIYCGSETRVSNSRHQKRSNHVWRRRACLNCKAVFTTLEAADAASAIRIQRHNTLEPFSREHLLISVYDSLRHRKTAAKDATALTDTIMTSLYALVDEAKLDRNTIVEVTTSVLKRFDSVAATHYTAFHPIRRADA